MKSIIIGFIILSGFALSVVTSFFFKKRHIDLFDDNTIEKIKGWNYKLLEIKRKRRVQAFPGDGVAPYNEYPLEAEYPIPWPLSKSKDTIEVYSVIEDNTTYLLSHVTQA
jgi:hypothetical protein